MKILIAVTISVFIMFFSNSVTAVPFLHDHQPANNTYTQGGIITLSINVSDSNLNTSSATVYMIEAGAYQRGESWKKESLSCIGGPSEWNCSMGFLASTIGSDTLEFFYFESSDTSGNVGNNGTTSNYLRFTLDRNPPIIFFTSPTNGSYVGGNKTIILSVSDVSSGVNNNSVQYRIGSGDWKIIKNSSLTNFEDVWNTTVLSNNQTVIIYVNASDTVGNGVLDNITVSVDNEIPKIDILSSLSGTLMGNVELQVNVNDSYSGINLGNVRYTVDGLSGTLGCTGSNYSATCGTIMNTVALEDGNHILVFSVTDKAGNINTSSVQIKTGNTLPAISITQPANNAFVKGNVLVRATITNALGTVNSTEISIDRSGNKTVSNMMCNSNFTSCNYSLDSVPYVDGGYTIKVKATRTVSPDVSSSISVSIDNTKPSLSIIQPSTDVKGDFEIKADIVDTNLDQNKISFIIDSFNGSLVCTLQTPSRFICSTFFNSKKLSDGKHILNVSAEDKAGNLIVVSKEINVINQQSAGGATSSGSVSGSSGTETTPLEPSEQTTKKEGGTSFLGISLQFKSQYVVLAVVTIAVILIIIILVVIASHRLGKNYYYS